MFQKLILKSFRVGNKLLNSFKDGAISVAIKTHVAKKQDIQGWDVVYLYLFNHDLSLSSVSSTMEETMLCVFDFAAVTELILNYILAKQSIVLAATICP